MKRVKTSANQIINLGDPIGKGGQATVFTVHEDNTLCAKIYNDKQKASKLHLKVSEMISIYKNIREKNSTKVFYLDNYLAWPRARLFDNSNSIIGFLMNKLPLKTAEKLDNFFNEDLSGRRSWKNRLQIALNLLDVIKYLHSMGVVVGDLHGANIYVLQDDKVALIDCDSFQIGKSYPVSAIQDEIAPPETKYVEYLEPESDVFTVSILIYRLLMDGYNPFSYVRAGTVDPDLDQSKSAGLAPIRDSSLPLPPKSPPLTRLSQNLRPALGKSLDPMPSKRGSIDDLIKELDKELKTNAGKRVRPTKIHKTLQISGGKKPITQTIIQPIPPANFNPKPYIVPATPYKKISTFDFRRLFMLPFSFICSLVFLLYRNTLMPYFQPYTDQTVIFLNNNGVSTNNILFYMIIFTGIVSLFLLTKTFCSKRDGMFYFVLLINYILFASIIDALLKTIEIRYLITYSEYIISIFIGMILSFVLEPIIAHILYLMKLLNSRLAITLTWIVVIALMFFTISHEKTYLLIFNNKRLKIGQRTG